MAQSRKPAKCAENCRFVLITGYRGNTSIQDVEDRAKWNTWVLYANLYNLRPTDRPNAPVGTVVNNDSPLNTSEWSRDSLKEIHDHINQMPESDDITIIFVAHSYGANLLHHALKADQLKEYLRGQNVPDSCCDERITKIRDHMAIFTLGGTQDITEEFAKVALNILFREDNLAKRGKQFLGTPEDRVLTMTMAYRGDGEGLENNQRKEQFDSSQGRNSLSLLASLFNSASSSSRSYGPHDLDQYTGNECVNEAIFKILNE